MLTRRLGLGSAIMLGLGSIVGTGAFVSLGLASEIAGLWALPALVLAGAVAALNGLSSAQLAAAHPVSGGTYEYGHRTLTPSIGFAAGWTFLCAKSASAATAALGCAGYALHWFGVDDPNARRGSAIAICIGVTLLVAGGLKRSNLANTLIVSVTLIALLAFAIAGLISFESANLGIGESARAVAARENSPFDLMLFLQATALLFVAYTGYGRIATLGEEARDPSRTIPRAIIATLFASCALYALVALGAFASSGADAFAASTKASAAPLESLAAKLGMPGLRTLMVIGALTAMLGVLLNLVLGLSRVVLAMARRDDLPRSFAKLKGDEPSPRAAVVLVGVIIASLAAIGDVRATWSFSAFTVLLYYAITNLAAARLPKDQRRYPVALAWLGFALCLSLAWFVPLEIWLSGSGIVALGFVWRWLWRKRALGRSVA